MRRQLYLLISAIIVFGSSLAYSLAPPHVKADLLAEPLSIQPGQPFWVAVRLKMDPGWHTYWKNPGDSGMSTRITWTLPEGYKAGPIVWPAPHKIELAPLASYGYEEEAILLTAINTPAVIKNLKKVSIQAKINWLECKEACYPGHADLKTELPVSIETPLPNPRMAGNFSLARFKLPIDQSEWKIRASQDKATITFVLDPPSWFRASPLPTILFFPDQIGLIENAAPQEVFTADSHLVIQIPKAEISTQTFTSVNGVLVSGTGWKGPQTETALNINLPLPQATRLYTPAVPQNSALPFGLALLFAFMGGILLNLMPCVLPVLSIKVLSFVKKHDMDKNERILNGLLYALGVLLSFLSLAGLLLFLKHTGEGVGWGFQLQSATFVGFLACLFFILSLNLFGVFEIGVSLGRFGTVAPTSSNRVSSFVSGVLATIVATPCTAPFMGSALGYALTVAPAKALSIFSLLGMGMASPYVALTAFPVLLHFVPKPGAWMETFKQALGFLFMSTVLWLLWVFHQEQGDSSVLSILTALLLFGLSAWAFGKHQFSGGRTGRVLWAVLSLLIFLGGSKLAYQSSRKIQEQKKSDEGIVWEPYTSQRFLEARNEGRPVFIDFSAAWCLTCQVNERTVLASKNVVRSFRDKKIAAFKADWTSRDEAITKELNKLGRNGVPVYVYYSGEKGPAPVLLPEVLTPSIVLSTIGK